MEYTVNALAKLSGLTPRTLRWYDHIGLLRPGRGPNGYRRYGPAELARLQQILFYREAGLELEAIAAILDDGSFDAEAALRSHLAALRNQKRHLARLITTAERTLAELKGDITMTDHEKFEGFKQQLVDDNEAQYGAEVRRRWGDEAADTSNAKLMNMTQAEHDAFTRLSEAVNAALAEAVRSGNPTGPAGQRAAALHKQWLQCTWPSYSAEAHRNLAQMYVDDERFTQYYEQVAPGAASVLRDAIFAFTEGGG